MEEEYATNTTMKATPTALINSLDPVRRGGTGARAVSVCRRKVGDIRISEGVGLILVAILLAACTVSKTLPIQNDLPDSVGAVFDEKPTAAIVPAGLLGKTIAIEFETAGVRTTGSQSAPINPLAESTVIKILKTGEVFLFAHAGAERGMEFKINEEVDLTKNRDYGDPEVWENVDVTSWHDWAIFSTSNLTMSATMEGVPKSMGGTASMKDQTLWEIDFSSDFQQCEIERVLLRLTLQPTNTIQEQSLSRPLHCTVT